MKKTFVLIAMALLTVPVLAQSKIGTIDADYIIAQMPEMTEINAGLEAYNLELQDQLKGNIAEYETLVKDYQEKSAVFTDVEKQEKEQQIMGLENDIKGFRQKAGVMIQMKRNDLTQPLYTKINDAMLKVVEAEKYTQIFHAGGNILAYSDESADVTLKVMKIMGVTVKE